MYYYNHFEEFENLKNKGCLFQLNLLSLTDYYGDGISKLCQKLMDKGMYDFVGSDTHHYKHLESYTKPIKKKNISYLKELLTNNNTVFTEDLVLL